MSFIEFLQIVPESSLGLENRVLYQALSSLGPNCYSEIFCLLLVREIIHLLDLVFTRIVNDLKLFQTFMKPIASTSYCFDSVKSILNLRSRNENKFVLEKLIFRDIDDIRKNFFLRWLNSSIYNSSKRRLVSVRVSFKCFILLYMPNSL